MTGYTPDHNVWFIGITNNPQNHYSILFFLDKNSVADNERINTPNPAPDDSTTPTCDYCKFTSPIPDSDFRELRKLGMTLYKKVLLNFSRFMYNIFFYI